MRTGLWLAALLAALGVTALVACGESETTVEASPTAAVASSPTAGRPWPPSEATESPAPARPAPSGTSTTATPAEIARPRLEPRQPAAPTVAASEALAQPTPVNRISAATATFDLDRFNREIASVPTPGIRLAGSVSGTRLGTEVISYASSSIDRSRQYRVDYAQARPPVTVELRESGNRVYIRVTGFGLASLAEWGPDWMWVPSDDVVGNDEDIFPPEADLGLHLLTDPVEAVEVIPCESAPGCFVLKATDDQSGWLLLITTDTYEPRQLINGGDDGGSTAAFSIEWGTEVSIEAPSDAHAVTADDVEGSLVATLQALQSPVAEGLEISGDPDAFDWARFHDGIAWALESSYVARVSFVNEQLGPMDVAVAVGPGPLRQSVVITVSEGASRTEIELRAIDGSTYLRGQTPDHSVTWLGTGDAGAERLLPSLEFFHLDVLAVEGLRVLGMVPCAENATCWLIAELEGARRLILVDATSLLPIRIEDPEGTGNGPQPVTLDMTPTTDVIAPVEFEMTTAEDLTDTLNELIQRASVAANPTPTAGPDGDRIQLEDEGRNHVAETETPTYRQIPPASGEHYPRWERYGVYTEAVQPGYWVHNLEHGAIVLLYQCDQDCEGVVQQIDEVFARLPAGAFGEVKLVATPFDLPLDHAFVLIAWNWQEPFDEFDADRIERFYADFVDRGPEGAP